MQKRAMGLENEMSLLVISGDQNNSRSFIENTLPLTNELMVQFLKIMEDRNIKPAYNVCGGGNNFLFNGGRIYKDRSEVLESATAECSNPDETADYELANEAILLDVLEKADELFLKKGAKTGLYFEVSKKCGDFRKDSGGSGCHENYHLEKPLGWRRVRDFNDLDDFLNDLSPYLIPYLASRSPFIGSGHLDNDGRFIASHRLSVTGSLYSSTNVNNGDKKTMLLIREEKNGDVDGQCGKFRLQICASDSNMSSFCVKFKFGPTSIILRMIEEGFWAKPPVALEKTLWTVKDAAGGDPNLKVLLANGQTVSLLEINKLYFAEAGKFFKTRVKSDDENKIMDLWERVLRIQEKCPSILDKAIDWRVLRCFLTAVLEKKYNWSWETLETNLQSDDLTIKKKAQQALKILQMFNLQYFFLRKNDVRPILKNSGLLDARLKSPEDYFDSSLKFNPRIPGLNGVLTR